MSRMGRRLTLLTAACASLYGGAVSAQSVSGAIRDADASPSAFARDRGMTVRDRPRPDYEALGIPAGAFTFFPKVQLDVEGSDNIFAAQNGEQSDTIARLRPDLRLRSDWSRHSLAFFGRANTSAYADNSDQNTTDWTVGGTGRVDVTRDSNLNAGADYGKLTEARTSASTPLQTEEPIRYNQGQAYIAGATTLNRLRLSSRLDYRTFDYDDGRTADGTVIEQDDRDRDITTLTGRADYAISPATALFVQITGNKRDYKIARSALQPQRDSSGYEALVGSNFELSALIRGELAVGYIEQEFDSSTYRTIDGFGARGELTWMPTELTTLTLTGTRTIEDAGIIGSAGYLSSQVSLQVDHELLRNVILTGLVNYGQDDYDDIARTDDRWGASFSGTYLLNRNLGLVLAVSHASRSSDGVAGQNYDLNRVIFSVVAQF